MRLLRSRFGLVASMVVLAFTTSATTVYFYPSSVSEVAPQAARAGITGQATPAPLRTPGPPTWLVKDAEEFSEFSLYWLGEEFRGLPLTRIVRYRFDPLPGSVHEFSRENSVTFIYGDCVPTPEQETGCPAPLYMKVEPHCSRSAQLTPAAFTGGQPISIGGITGRITDERHVVVWTGDVTLSIGVADPDATPAVDIPTALAPLNAVARNAGTTLPQPDLSGCPQ